jgi:hypothetical protein
MQGRTYGSLLVVGFTSVDLVVCYDGHINDEHVTTSINKPENGINIYLY